jgi:hypothetical protein
MPIPLLNYEKIIERRDRTKYAEKTRKKETDRTGYLSGSFWGGRRYSSPLLGWVENNFNQQKVISLFRHFSILIDVFVLYNTFGVCYDCVLLKSKIVNPCSTINCFALSFPGSSWECILNATASFL